MRGRVRGGGVERKQRPHAVGRILTGSDFNL